ncbi:MAG: hypothetical protein GYB50_03775 [Rhodobacteraceae bacterium]|nr:hypothetical protein [Paracoccaceae bacterium]
MANPGHLRKITAEVLGPIWARRDIPVSRIAAHLGVSHQAVSAHARRLGLPPRGRTNKDSLKRGSDADLRKLWLAGISTREIAKALGFTQGASVSTRARRLGLPPRAGGGIRSHEYRPTMTLAELREIEMAAAMQAAAAVSKSA